MFCYNKLRCVCIYIYVGATLGKGLNRVAATLLAGALGIGAHHLASMSGPTGEPILLAIFVFVQGVFYILITSLYV